MIPGDLTTVQTSLVGPNTAAASIPGNGMVDWQDGVIAQQNLSSAGLIVCPLCMNTTTASAGHGTAKNSVLNTFGFPVYYQTWIGGPDGDTYLDAQIAAPARLVFITGYGVPAAAHAEIDRKSDDGFPNSGNYRYSAGIFESGIASGFLPANVTTWSLLAQCVTTTASGTQLWFLQGNSCAGGWTIF
jgi:hypothetical protein